MNAHTAKPDHGTPKISDSDTVTPVASTIRIDEFIKTQFDKVESGDFSGIKHSAEKLARFGFRSCANSRYAEFLEAFQSTPHLAQHYADAYPNCCFLPWTAFHATIRSLDLWCDVPEFYAGAIPDEQIPWLEIFEFNPADAPVLKDLLQMMEYPEDHRAMRILGDLWHSLEGRNHEVRDLEAAYQYSSVSQYNTLRGEVRVISDYMKQFRDSLFVMAPKEAFNSTADFIERFKKAVEAATTPTVAPNDPLVVRVVRGGVLVIAAWGDEAAVLNQVTRDLNI